MSGEENHTTLGGDPTNSATHPPPPKDSTEQVLDDLAVYLAECFRITEDADSYKNRRRFIILKKNEIFVELVHLYTHMFNSHWNHFKRAHEAFKQQQTATPAAETSTEGEDADKRRAKFTDLPENPCYMAKVYISHWILDVYRSIREACPDLSGLAFQNKFKHAVEEQSPIYDTFLANLNAHLRPTPISGILEDALFIPYFEVNRADPFEDPKNPFDIDNFTLNVDYFRNTVTTIQDKRSGWTTKSKSTSLVGRPSWLFDWPSAQNMCAWFPMEQNFTVDDCVVAYIIGVACTPKLAPRDADAIQQWSNNTRPTNPRLGSLTRARPRTKDAGYIYREIEDNIKSDIVYNNPFDYLNRDPTRLSKRKRKEPTKDVASSSTEPGFDALMEIDPPIDPTFVTEFSGYRITDYLYFYRLVKKITEDQRKLLLHNILHDESA